MTSDLGSILNILLSLLVIVYLLALLVTSLRRHPSLHRMLNDTNMRDILEIFAHHYLRGEYMSLAVRRDPGNLPFTSIGAFDADGNRLLRFMVRGGADASDVEGDDANANADAEDDHASTQPSSPSQTVIPFRVPSPTDDPQSF